jgi:hypothetical protein
MSFIHRGSAPSDPLSELRDEVDSIRGELATLQDTIKTNHEAVMSALGDILRELESKPDRD